ncbi:hypothetical protein C453_17189 [Haloferax elongans ATCC BAA-1513]|uniref:Uncharacterized protein n=1 Tax=Haloferax elongans ATCC BAA-1513 TaxID=1230453 RepID=M0HDF3_HALEO|nr:hypothetical protein C453_17189 [Haloferax elongans ATCC BAA-1513]
MTVVYSNQTKFDQQLYCADRNRVSRYSFVTQLLNEIHMLMRHMIDLIDSQSQDIRVTAVDVVASHTYG